MFYTCHCIDKGIKREILIGHLTRSNVNVTLSELT